MIIKDKNDYKTSTSLITDPEAGKVPFFGGKKSNTRTKYGNGPRCSKCIQNTIDKATLPKAMEPSEIPEATLVYKVKPDMAYWANQHPKAEVNETTIQTATRIGGNKMSKKNKKKSHKSTRKHKKETN